MDGWAGGGAPQAGDGAFGALLTQRGLTGILQVWLPQLRLHDAPAHVVIDQQHAQALQGVEQGGDGFAAMRTGRPLPAAASCRWHTFGKLAPVMPASEPLPQLSGKNWGDTLKKRGLCVLQPHTLLRVEARMKASEGAMQGLPPGRKSAPSFSC